MVFRLLDSNGNVIETAETNHTLLDTGTHSRINLTASQRKVLMIPVF